MEGGGEVMLVRTLRGSDLAITLFCGNQRQKHSFGGSKSPTRVVHSNVATNTVASHTESAVQIDGTRLSGNYESHNGTAFARSRREYPQRSRVISRMFHNTDAFAESLRKYPHPGDLEKSQSDEIVQRILSYAQGRNFAKGSKSKSMRSLLRKNSSHKKRNKRCFGGVANSISNWWDRPLDADCTSPGELDTRYNYLNSSMSKPGIEVRYLTDVKQALCRKLLDMCNDTPKVCPRIQSRYSHHRRHCSQAPPRQSSERKSLAVQVLPPDETEDVSAVSYHGIENHSKKACFCQTPQKCVCTVKSENQSSSGTIEDMIMKLVPELNLNETEDFTSLVQTQIKEWVNQVPPFYNVEITNEEKEKLIVDLTRELNNIEDMNLDDVKKNTLRCLKNTPALRDKRDSIIDDLGNNLINKVKYLVVQNQWQNNISDLVTDILAKYDLSDKNKDLITKAVAHKLKPIVMNRALPNQDFKGFLTDEVLGLIQQLPLDVKENGTRLNPQNKTNDFKQDYNVTQMDAEVGSNFQEVEITVLDWLKFLPQISNIPSSERKRIVIPLVKSLTKQENPEEMKIVIKNWLNDVINKDDTHISSRSINKLSNKLISELQQLREQSDPKYTVKIIPNEDDNLEANIKENIMDGLRDIPEFPFRINREKETVDKLANRLNEIINDTRDLDEIAPVIRTEIRDWIKNTLKENNINYIPPSDIDNFINSLVNKMINKTQSIKRYKLRPSRESPILNTEIETWLTDLPYIDTKNVKIYKQLTQTLAEDLSNIQNKKYNAKYLERKVNEVINRWISKVNKETGTDVHPKDKQTLINNVLNKMKSHYSEQDAPKPHSTQDSPKNSSNRVRPQTYSNQVTTPKSRKKWRKVRTAKRDIHDGVSKVLNKYSSNYMNKTKEDLISKISDEVEKRLSSVTSPDLDETKASISKILEDYTNFTSKDIDDIANDVVDKVIRFSAPNIVERSTFSPRVNSNEDSSNLDKYGKSRNQNYPRDLRSDEFSTKTNSGNYQNDNEQTYQDFNEDLQTNFETDDDNDQRKLNYDAKDYQRNNNVNADDLNAVSMKNHRFFKNIAQDISNNIDKFLVKTDEQQDRTRAFGQRATSTPEKQLRPSIDTLSIPSIHTKSYEGEKETPAINHIKSILRDWLHSLNMEDTLKNKIINDLTEDIIDRQRYLKLSNSKTRKSVELEHLKFQVFKRLNKIISDQELSNYMNEIIDLAKRLSLFEACDDGSYETEESLTYKNKLYVVISHTLPSFTHDESLEVFKHDLADAFVSLHFCTDNQRARNKYKNKIREEISHFCCDYLIRYPASHLNTKQLNKELYIALLKVPVPNKESLENTHRISIIQEGICSWLNKTEPSIVKSMKIRENISILAKNLFNIQENESKSNDIEQDMIKLISDWLNDFSLMTGQNIDIETECKILLNNIQNLRHESNNGLRGVDKTESDKLTINVSQNVDTCTANKSDNATQYTPLVPPPSTLSAEDRAHLDRIRARNVVNKIHIHPQKDASNDPLPINTSTQTDLIINADADAQNSPVTQTTHSTTEKIVNVDITPQVVVKEYHWESIDSSEPSKLYTPQGINITVPTSPIDVREKIDIITHNEFTQSPPIISTTQQQPNISTQTTNLSSPHVSNSKQRQSHNITTAKTMGPLINERISEACSEKPDITEHFIYPPDIGVSINQRPVLSGFPTPYEERITNLQRTRCLDERVVRDNYGGRGLVPYLKNNEVFRRSKRPDKYETKVNKCCRCGNRILTKCRSPRYCQHHRNHNQMCSKCYSGLCPHPTSLYFHSDF